MQIKNGHSQLFWNHSLHRQVLKLESVQKILSFCTKIADRILFYILRWRGLYGSECVYPHTPFSERVPCVCNTTLRRSSSDVQVVHVQITRCVRGVYWLQRGTHPISVKHVYGVSMQKDPVTSHFIISKGAFKNCRTEVACHFNLICGKLLNKSSCLPQITPRISSLMRCSAIKSV